MAVTKPMQHGRVVVVVAVPDAVRDFHQARQVTAVEPHHGQRVLRGNCRGQTTPAVLRDGVVVLQLQMDEPRHHRGQRGGACVRNVAVLHKQVLQCNGERQHQLLQHNAHLVTDAAVVDGEVRHVWVCLHGVDQVEHAFLCHAGVAAAHAVERQRQIFEQRSGFAHTLVAQVRVVIGKQADEVAAPYAVKQVHEPRWFEVVQHENCNESNTQSRAV